MPGALFALSFERASKSYGDVLALSELTFEVPPGVVFALVGPNGAGKDDGDRPPDRPPRADGGIDDGLRYRRRAAAGRDEAPPRLRPGPPVPLAPLDAARDAPLRRRGLRRAGRGARGADRARSCRLFGLDGAADRTNETLSHGTRQKVALAQAFLHDPRLFVLDEPMVGLDPLAQKLLVERLRERTASGAAVLLTTHQLSLAEEVADDAGVLVKGRLVARGAPRQMTGPRADGAAVGALLRPRLGRRPAVNAARVALANSLKALARGLSPRSTWEAAGALSVASRRDRLRRRRVRRARVPAAPLRARLRRAARARPGGPPRTAPPRRPHRHGGPPPPRVADDGRLDALPLRGAPPPDGAPDPARPAPPPADGRDHRALLRPRDPPRPARVVLAARHGPAPVAGAGALAAAFLFVVLLVGHSRLGARARASSLSSLPAAPASSRRSSRPRDSPWRSSGCGARVPSGFCDPVAALDLLLRLGTTPARRSGLEPARARRRAAARGLAGEAAGLLLALALLASAVVVIGRPPVAPRAGPPPPPSPEPRGGRGLAPAAAPRASPLRTGRSSSGPRRARSCATPSTPAQLGTLAAVFVLDLLNLRLLPSGDAASRDVVHGLQAGLGLFLVSALSLRFAYPAVSTDGRAALLLRTLPHSPARHLVARWAVRAAPSLFAALAPRDRLGRRPRGDGVRPRSGARRRDRRRPRDSRPPARSGSPLPALRRPEPDLRRPRPRRALRDGPLHAPRRGAGPLRQRRAPEPPRDAARRAARRTAPPGGLVRRRDRPRGCRDARRGAEAAEGRPLRRLTVRPRGSAAASPRSTRAASSHAVRAIATRDSLVDDPRCGRRTTFGSGRSAGWTAGSFSKTSRPAPPRWPEARAAARAASSTIGPRAVLTRIAPAFIRANSAAPNRRRVSGVSGAWSVRTSDSARRRSNASGESPSTVETTRIPNASARRATARADPPHAVDAERLPFERGAQSARAASSRPSSRSGSGRRLRGNGARRRGSGARSGRRSPRSGLLACSSRRCPACGRRRGRRCRSRRRSSRRPSAAERARGGPRSPSLAGSG